MKPEQDPRIKVARRGLVVAWTFYSLFLASVLSVAAACGNDPLWLGLPRWVALACFVLPALFVVALIPIVETLIPDIPLSDEEDRPS
ncbi:MAG TPA: DUF997 family protein [Thermoanaerobaculia bacterium]